MTVRTYRTSDREALEKIAADSGFPYSSLDSPLLEGCFVAADENDVPVLVLAAHRAAHLELYVSRGTPVLSCLHLIRELAQNMRAHLCSHGYTECDGYLPPEIEKSFGRRLVRTFGAVRNWASYCFRV